MVLFVFVVSGLGWIFSQMFADGNQYVTVYIVIGAMIYTIFSYYSSSKMALGLNGAKEIEFADPCISLDAGPREPVLEDTRECGQPPAGVREHPH